MISVICDLKQGFLFVFFFFSKWIMSSRIHRSASRTLRPLTSYLKAHLFSAPLNFFLCVSSKNKSISDEIRVEVPSVICPVFFLNSRSVHHREVSHYEDAKPWNERCDLAFYCTTRNEIEKSDIVSLLTGSTMACTSQAVDVLRKANFSNKGCWNWRGFKLGSVEHTSEAIVKKYGAVSSVEGKVGVHHLDEVLREETSSSNATEGHEIHSSWLVKFTSNIVNLDLVGLDKMLVDGICDVTITNDGNIQFCELPLNACVKIV
ncbi:hypothetical protein C5167_043595 [Papaver somniferum]|uniref:Uncharacterized protein n=1 Tax=Papaver somniferum TaxID=3469 RepID=A0A4Y7L754_PAPSO|nr:hypothetical protein C5167_043595 [Papaver somniferum]